MTPFAVTLTDRDARARERAVKADRGDAEVEVQRSIESTRRFVNGSLGSPGAHTAVTAVPAGPPGTPDRWGTVPGIPVPRDIGLSHDDYSG